MPVILLILIFIRPFISSLAFPYINLIYSILLLGALAIWIIIKGIHLNELKPIRYPLILFILALFISLIFSQDRMVSVEELYKYITGILLLLVNTSLIHKQRQRTILCIIISGFLISILAIYQYFFGFQHLLGYISKQGITNSFILDYVSRKRVFFPFVTPNTLAGYLAMIIPLSLAHKNRVCFIILLSFALLLTKSLGGLLSLLFGLAIYFYLSHPSAQGLGLQGKLEKRRVLILFGLLIIIILVVIVRSATQKQHIQPIFSGMMRLNYWQDTLKIIKTYPLTGVGLGNFNLPQSRYAHNSYLQLWAEMGIIGIISFIWLITALLKSAFIKFKNYPDKNQIIIFFSACIIFLIHNLVDFTFFLPEVSIIWWTILSILSSYENKN